MSQINSVPCVHLSPNRLKQTRQEKFLTDDWVCCISEAHFRVCDFGVVPFFQNFLQISRVRFFPLVNALRFAFATCFLTLQTQILGFQWKKKWVKLYTLLLYLMIKKPKTRSGKSWEAFGRGKSSSYLGKVCIFFPPTLFYKNHRNILL